MVEKGMIFPLSVFVLVALAGGGCEKTETGGILSKETEGTMKAVPEKTDLPPVAAGVSREAKVTRSALPRVAKDQEALRQMLTGSPVSEMSLVAVAPGTAEPFAIVRIPSGVELVVRPGTLLGSEGGKVVRITEKELVVAEIALDPTGKVSLTERSLPLVVEETDQPGLEPSP